MAKHYLPEEQGHRSYYERQERKHLQDCAYSFKAMSVIALIFLLIMLLSCATAKVPAATTSYGTVIAVKGDTVWVLFDVVNRKEGDKASNYFYIPGHRYAEGDRYPDPYKDPEMEKLLLSPPVPHSSPSRGRSGGGKSPWSVSSPTGISNP